MLTLRIGDGSFVNAVAVLYGDGHGGFAPVVEYTESIEYLSTSPT